MLQVDIHIREQITNIQVFPRTRAAKILFWFMLHFGGWSLRLTFDDGRDRLFNLEK